MINGHGNNLYSFEKGKIKYDFSSNIAFNNKSDDIINHLKATLNSIKNYPHPSAVNLAKKLAEFHKINEENILVVNGSAEAFYIVAHFLSIINNLSCNSLILTPSFAEYEDSCTLYKHTLSFEEIEHFEAKDISEQNSIWLGVPNNPNGYITPDKLIEAKSKENLNCLFIIDRAYNQLSEISDNKISISKNIIYINSLTKSFGIPGIRLGYIIASKDIIAQLSQMRPPWSVNSLAIHSGEYIIDNYSQLLFNKRELLGESYFLQQEIQKLSNFYVYPSKSNFFLCRIECASTSEELQEYLIEKHGILIRDASNFRSLSNKHFRIAAQKRDANIHLINALKEWK